MWLGVWLAGGGCGCLVPLPFPLDALYHLASNIGENFSATEIVYEHKKVFFFGNQPFLSVLHLYIDCSALEMWNSI